MVHLAFVGFFVGFFSSLICMLHKESSELRNGSDVSVSLCLSHIFPFPPSLCKSLSSSVWFFSPFRKTSQCNQRNENREHAWRKKQIKVVSFIYEASPFSRNSDFCFKRLRGRDGGEEQTCLLSANTFMSSPFVSRSLSQESEDR